MLAVYPPTSVNQSCDSICSPCSRCAPNTELMSAEVRSQAHDKALANKPSYTFTVNKVMKISKVVFPLQALKDLKLKDYHSRTA